jgi:hypothetical protein
MTALLADSLRAKEVENYGQNLDSINFQSLSESTWPSTVVKLTDSPPALSGAPFEDKQSTHFKSRATNSYKYKESELREVGQMSS